MIRKQTPEDLVQIMDIIKKSNHKFDGRIFLPDVIKSPDIYVDIENDNIEGLAYVSEKILNLHGKRIKIAYINASMMSEKSLARLVKILRRTDMITMIQATPEMSLENLGFEPVIEISQYNLSTDYLPKITVDGIVLNPEPHKLLEVYNNFMNHFNGYFERDVDYFKSIKKVLGSAGSIVGFEHDGELCGHVVFETHENVVIVKEACYQKSGHLLAMLAFASRGKRRLVLHTSAFEHLTRVLPHAKKSKETFMFASINDKELFEHLFHIKIISAYSAFNAFGKALWNRDYF